VGLFDKVLGKDTSVISLSKQDAFSAIAVAAVAADEDISSEEVQRIALNLASIKLFRNYDLRDLSQTLHKNYGLIKRRGTGPVLQASKAALSPEQLTSAFFVAADLVLSDGVVEEAEKKFLEELQHTLAIDEGQALKIVDVAVLKNRA
jgi:tellurite resistance protein